MALGTAALYLRRRRSAPDAAPAPLSAEEKARLKEILEK
jgi:cytochrome c-type biogenesis protein CcmH